MMITPPFIEQAREAAGSFANDTLLHEDLWRITNAWFGPRAHPHGTNPVMLLLGARSGLEAALATAANPATNLHVVEPLAGLRDRLVKTVGANVTVHSSLANALASNMPPSIAYVRMDRSCFNLGTLTTLVRNREIGYLCGEIDSSCADPLAVYRLLQEETSGFFLRRDHDGKTMSSRDKRPDIEVSVVVAAYGVEDVLDKCLASLANQSLERIEILVVDDGSNDHTGVIADSWAHRFPDRIQVIHKPNGGCASARMAGLAAAQGLYVGFVDGDDWVAPTMYEELYRAAVLESAEVAQCGFYDAFSDGSVTLHPTAFAGDGPGGTSGVVHNTKCLLGLQPSIWRRIYNRTFLMSHNIEFPIHIKRFDDLPFSFLSLAHARRVALIPDCYYAYRQGRPGQDTAARDERLFVHFDIFHWLYERIVPWATQELLREFHLVEQASHLWALERIESRFAPEYRRRSIAQMRLHRAPARLRANVWLAIRTRPIVRKLA